MGMHSGVVRLDLQQKQQILATLKDSAQDAVRHSGVGCFRVHQQALQKCECCSVGAEDDLALDSASGAVPGLRAEAGLFLLQASTERRCVRRYQNQRCGKPRSRALTFHHQQPVRGVRCSERATGIAAGRTPLRGVAAVDPKDF